MPMSKRAAELLPDVLTLLAHDEEFRQAIARFFATRGGSSGTGKAKLRGGQTKSERAEYYAKLAAKSHKKRMSNNAARLAREEAEK